MFVGPTSNTGFLEDILSAHHIGFDTGNHTSPVVGERSELRSRFLSRMTSLAPAVTLAANEQIPKPSILPPKEEIMHLVNHFFANTGKLFPYLYKPLVMDALSKMAVDGYQNVERTQLCILNLIMAFATTHGPSEEPIRARMARGDIFLQRALALIPNISPAVHNLECSTLFDRPFERSRAYADDCFSSSPCPSDAVRSRYARLRIYMGNTRPSRDCISASRYVSDTPEVYARRPPEDGASETNMVDVLSDGQVCALIIAAFPFHLAILVNTQCCTGCVV